MTRGQVTTSNITGTPVPGEVAYADETTAGNITNASALFGAGSVSGQMAVGRFLSGKDADGYAKVSVNLPNHGA